MTAQAAGALPEARLRHAGAARGRGVSGPEMGKLKWVTESVSFSCQDPPPKFTKSVSFPSAFRELSVSFPSAFRVTRFRLPVSGPLKEERLPQVSELPLGQLRPQFAAQVEKLRGKVF